MQLTPTVPLGVETTVEAVEQPRVKSRVMYVNAVRVYAMTIVVLIHVAAILAPHMATIASSDWWISNMFHGFSKGGPPIFTLVSGMLLLGGKDQPLTDFFRKRFMKVLLPFIGWAFIYLLWRAHNGEVFTLTSATQAILNGPAYYHMWFIQMILGMYLATPILRVFVRNASQELLRYSIAIWVIAVSLVPLLNEFTDFNIGIQFVVTTGFVGYFILGYALRNVTLTPRQMLPTLLMVVGSILLTEFLTYRLTADNDQMLNIFFLNNQGLNIIVIAVGMFLFLKSLPYEAIFARLPRLEQALQVAASCSLGVYFVHVLVMEVFGSGLLGFRLGPLTGGALIGIPLTWLVTLAVSLAITWVLKQIPLVKILVPG
ncbi:MAG: acyltransferase family protein [Chloroflexota bacterium]|nr:acyltransferase family protein [Chloroflexota bacterium]